MPPAINEASYNGASFSVTISLSPSRIRSVSSGEAIELLDSCDFLSFLIFLTLVVFLMVFGGALPAPYGLSEADPKNFWNSGFGSSVTSSTSSSMSTVSSLGKDMLTALIAAPSWSPTRASSSTSRSKPALNSNRSTSICSALKLLSVFLATKSDISSPLRATSFESLGYSEEKSGP